MWQEIPPWGCMCHGNRDPYSALGTKVDTRCGNLTIFPTRRNYQIVIGKSMLSASGKLYKGHVGLFMPPRKMSFSIFPPIQEIISSSTHPSVIGYSKFPKTQIMPFGFLIYSFQKRLNKVHIDTAHNVPTRQADSVMVIFDGTQYLNTGFLILYQHMNCFHFFIMVIFLIWGPGTKLI